MISPKVGHNLASGVLKFGDFFTCWCHWNNCFFLDAGYWCKNKSINKCIPPQWFINPLKPEQIGLNALLLKNCTRANELLFLSSL